MTILFLTAISTHTLTWSVTCVVQISVAVQKFQLTRSRGAWLKSSCLAHAVIHFNSHAHVERDFYKSSPILTSFCISTHTLTWSVTKFITCSSMVSGISTHTLTWSVTGNNIQCIEKRQFQLTRSRGAWRVQPIREDKDEYFNSHAHVERDCQVTSFSPPPRLSFQLTRSRGAWRTLLQNEFVPKLFQLTRSRGAWPSERTGFPATCLFQLTRSRGAWQYLVLIQLCAFWFQLTRSRGAWPVCSPYHRCRSNFNSHAHVERDLVANEMERRGYISTHTLTWSVTQLNGLNIYLFLISTHTLTWSVTCTESFLFTIITFQLTRSRGAWPLKIL